MRLGSDVPFFMGQTAALVTGRGEHVRAMRPRRDYSLLLVGADLEVKTANAFAWLDAEVPRGRVAAGCSPGCLAEAYRSSAIEHWRFYNSFGPVLERKHPEIACIQRELLLCGALFASVTGSGSTVFGVFGDGDQVESALRHFDGRYRFLKAARPLEERCPVRVHYVA